MRRSRRLRSGSGIRGSGLDRAQRLAVELMLAETAAGRWAARTTGRAEPRQNGKGDEIEVVEAWGLIQRAEWIVHTAHEIPTAKAAHRRLADHLESRIGICAGWSVGWAMRMGISRLN